jgi:cytochrome c553
MPNRFAVLAALTAALSFTAPAQAGMEEGRVKAQVCAACHGADGNSKIPGTPSIAGQPRQFIVQALYMFREGRRKNEQMTPFTEKLTNADLNDLALYFSSQKMVAPTHQTTPERIALGKTITEKNNCVACHKGDLTGQQHIPRIAGQGRDYLQGQLKQFRASTRADFDGTMTSATQGLTPEDIEVLADYLASLSVP